MRVGCPVWHLRLMWLVLQQRLADVEDLHGVGAAGGVVAVALGEPEGFIKTIFDARTGELLGAHMIGAEVTELIQGYSIAKTLETTEEDLVHTVFPHPTLSEMMHESVLSSLGRAIHI